MVIIVIQDTGEPSEVLCQLYPLTGVRPGPLREKKIRNTRRTEDRMLRCTDASAACGSWADSLFWVASKGPANTFWLFTSSATMASERIWLRYLPQRKHQLQHVQLLHWPRFHSPRLSTVESWCLLWPLLASPLQTTLNLQAWWLPHPS